jgi:HEXXH motif-containing protein
VDPRSNGSPSSLDIAARAISLIEHGAIWLPGLAAILATIEWKTLQRQYGLSSITYGTDRLRTADANAPRMVLAEVRVPQAEELGLAPIIVEHPFRSASHYRTLELSFYDETELGVYPVKRSLEAALDCLSLAPDLLTSVLHLVRVIHIVRPPSPEYDVSHSDPEVPFSVFVSLPVDVADRERLRLAEALLHEAMHLQLTLLESHVALVRTPEAAHYSPWKRSVRPVQGIMHGLYVFGVIDTFFEVAERFFGGQALSYVRDRRMQIAAEVAEATPTGLNVDMTDLGVTLLNAILARFARERRP